MPTYDLLRLRAIPGVEESLTLAGLEFRVNRSASEITLASGAKILFRSYDRPERIIAFEVAHAIVDEIDTLNKDKASLVWRKITERIRQTTKFMRDNNVPNSIACVTTPDQGFTGFVYDRWVKNVHKGYELIKASTYDNTFLPEGYTDQILANYDPILADMYLRGEFVSLTQDKQAWAFCREKHESVEVFDKDTLQINAAIDFNFNGCYSIIFKRIGDEIHFVDEIVGKNTQDLIARITSKYQQAKVVAFPDASGGNESANADKTSIGLLEEAGFRINAAKANPSVRASLASVNNRFAKDKLFVNSATCPFMVESLETIGYDDKGKPEKYNTHPSWDDALDVARYCVHRLYPTRKPSIVTTKR